MNNEIYIDQINN